MIKRETIEQLRVTANITEIVNSYVPLKRVGKYYRGRCPFHPDSSPSFYVSPERQVYHCFGCGAGGSVISFIMQIEKLDFPEAVKLLAAKLNIPVQTERTSSRYQALYAVCEFAAQFFSRQLTKYPAAVNYLLRRGMKDETVKRYRLGYAPGGNTLRAAAQRAGYSEELLLRVGLRAQRESGTGDWFYGRIIFPIMALSGRVIGFSGRVLDDSEPKYLNSSESEIFRKGENLYGLYQAKNALRSAAPILVEGNFDLLSLANRGIQNVVAPLGTAFTAAQAQLLRRFGNEIRILFDADDAGRRAARRTLEVLLREGFVPSVIILPDDYDPDEYLQEFGTERLRQLLEQPADPVRFILTLNPPKTVNEKNACLRELLSLVNLVPDAVLRELYLNRLAEEFQIAREILQNRLTAAPRPVAERAPASRDERLLALAAVSEDYARVARELLPPEIFAESGLQELARLVYMRIGEKDFGLAAVIDQLTDEGLKSRVAAWDFLVREQPSLPEYTVLARRRRSSWLCQAISAAEAENDQARADALRKEHFELRRQLLKKSEG